MGPSGVEGDVGTSMGMSEGCSASHGLCDMGASASAIPHSLYKEIMHDIAPAEIEEIDVTIKLANRDTISPVGIVRDVEVLWES